MKILSLCFATCSLLAGWLSAQTPAPVLPPESRQFDFWIGEWDVTTPDGKPAGSSRIERIANGAGLLENWSGYPAPAGGNGKSNAGGNGNSSSSNAGGNSSSGNAGGNSSSGNAGGNSGSSNAGGNGNGVGNGGTNAGGNGNSTTSNAGGNGNGKANGTS